MRTLLVIALIALVIWNAYRTPSSEYLYPRDGQSQRYRVKVTADQGHIEGGVTIRNENTVKIDGREYNKYVINFDGIPGSKTVTTYMRAEKDGIYSRRSTDRKEAQFLDLPLPPEVGRKWRYNVNGNVVEKEIVSIETVYTSQKSYEKCVKVVSKGISESGSIESTAYHAPGVGQVKAVMKFPAATVEMTLEE
jgi:hypothetical protein